MSHPSPSPDLTADPLVVRAIGRTDVGRQRETNEDAMIVDEAGGLFVVCDGMGGHASGQVASQLAVATIAEAMARSGPAADAPGDAADGAAPAGDEPLRAAMRRANDAVFQRSLSDPACHGMGTTAVGVRIDGAVAQVCHCGDSRLYLLRDGALAQLTRDHSLANLYEDKPELRERMGPATSNVIVRAVGLDEVVEIDHASLPLVAGDLLLLCCDGLTDLVPDATIREILSGSRDLDAIGDRLVATANGNGGSDNITVVLVGVAAAPPAGVALDADVLEYGGTRPGF